MSGLQLSGENPVPAGTSKRFNSTSVVYAIVAIGVTTLFLGLAVNYFSQKAGPTPSAKPPETPNKLSLLTCPLPASFCKESGFFKEGSFSAQLKEKTPVVAVMSGLIKGSPITYEKTKGQKEEYKLISITDPETRISAMYYLKGELNINAVKGTVKGGEIIATASGQPIDFLNKTSFVLLITKQTEEGTKLQPLTPANFK